MGDREFTIESDGTTAKASSQGKELFTVSTGTCVITDANGKPKKVINTSGESQTIRFCGKERTLDSNEIWELN